MTTEKTPIKKKRLKVGEIKKTLIGGGIIAGVAIAGIVGGLIFLRQIESNREPKPVTLIFGYPGIPNTLDPLEVYWDGDTRLLYQMAEGLFDIDENGETIHCLAINHTWSSDNLNLTCMLRRNVKFHDDTTFDASAVKWNLDRIYRLLDNLTYPFLWKFPDGTPIINETLVIDNYTVRIVLNRPFAPLEALLSCYSSYIISPTSSPEDRFLNIDSEKTIGTGPFIFKHFEPKVNISMIANSNYWGDVPEIDNLIMTALDSSEWLSGTALLTGDINMTIEGFFEDEVLDMFENNPSFVVESGPTNSLKWLVLNNNFINATMRKAISYALNYSVIETFGGVIRAKSPIPEGLPYYNITGIKVPYYNVSIARQILKDVDWNNTAGDLTADNNISVGNDWEKLVENGTPLAIYNYTYVKGLQDMSQLVSLLTENLKQIGVKVEPVNVSTGIWWGMITDRYGYHRNMFHLSYTWWGADYNDPYTMINMLFTNESAEVNAGQTNDHQLNLWMNEALEDLNPSARRQLYYNIQKYLIEELNPIAFSYSPIPITIYDSKIKGWYTHSLRWPFKHVYFEDLS